MRYVSVKSAEQQAQGMVFRTRDLFVRQRSQLVNALRGHLAEYGVVVAQGMVQFRPMITSFDAVAPMCATTIQAFAPPMEEFSNGREFAARVAVLCPGRSQPVGGKS